ncbi:MAG TPA: peptidoglycan DD-metalloendopeptidase family protein [Candidatus Limnocylindria bacterium]|nr:peptidoglycan DD-metalloendopeptidase family protein [Candidatus Limnocylindria bacterium]
MSTVRRRSLLTLALIALVVIVAPGGAHPTVRAGGGVDDAINEQQRMEAELARQRQQLADLRRQQAALNASLTALTTDLRRTGLELEKAVRQLERVTASLRESREALESYRTQIAHLADNLEQVAADLVTSRVELAEREVLLQDHLRLAYEQSQTSMLEILLSTDSFGEASNQLASMLTLSDEDRRLAEEIRETRERLAVRQQTLRDGQETLTALRDAEKERSTALAVQQRQVDAARRTLRTYQRRLEELKAEQEAQYRRSVHNEERTKALIDEEREELAGQRQLVERLKERADRLDIAYRGRFAWPEKGDFYVTQEFGWTTFDHNHTGMDMAYRNGCGGPIYAAGDGTVLADDRPNTAYGDTAIGVVIGHSQRLQTWYWHLQREVVSVGQTVKVGDLIGYEGATGIATGCHLHFQVNFDDQPVNPRNYLP